MASIQGDPDVLDCPPGMGTPSLLGQPSLLPAGGFSRALPLTEPNPAPRSPLILSLHLGPQCLSFPILPAYPKTTHRFH